MPDIKDPFEHKQEAKKQISSYFPEIPVKQELLIGEDVRLGQRDILPTQIVDRLLGTGAVVLHALNDTSVHSGSISDAQHGARGTIDHAHDAANIDNVPAGGIAAITVQAALNELDTDKANASHTQAETTITFTNVTTNDANTTNHGYLLKATAPGAGIRNIVAIDNAETVYKNTALFDTTAPTDLAGTATAGTSLIAARRDHVHLGLTSAQLTDLTDAGLSTLHSHYPRAPHLQQLDTTDQAIVNVSNAQVITFDTDSHHQAITRTSSSRFTITVDGSYLITFSGVAICGTAGKRIEVWLRINGSDVANSNTVYTFKSANANTVIAVQFLENFAVNDYFEFWTWGDDTGAKWDATAAGSTPTRPACPSIIITCNMVSDD